MKVKLLKKLRKHCHVKHVKRYGCDKEVIEHYLISKDGKTTAEVLKYPHSILFGWLDALLSMDIIGLSTYLSKSKSNKIKRNRLEFNKINYPK